MGGGIYDAALRGARTVRGFQRTERDARIIKRRTLTAFQGFSEQLEEGTDFQWLFLEKLSAQAE